MIDANDTFPDPKDDDVGVLLTAVQTGGSWTKQRLEARDALVRKLTELNYLAFTGNKMMFRLSGVGDSILYRVPMAKTGHLKPFRGLLVRLVCVRSAERLNFVIMAGQYQSRSDKREIQQSPEANE